MLRVGIDGRSFSSPAAGVRRYVSGLVPALMAVDARSRAGRARRIARCSARGSRSYRGAVASAVESRLEHRGYPARGGPGPRRCDSCPGVHRATVVEGSSCLDHSRRQLRASPGVVSVPARRAAPPLLSPQRTRGRARADRFRVLGRGDRRRVFDSARTDHRGATGRIQSLRTRGRHDEGRAAGRCDDAVSAACRRPSRAAQHAAGRSCHARGAATPRYAAACHWRWRESIAASAIV